LRVFISSGDGSEVFDLVEEPIDQIAISVEEGAERWDIGNGRHRLDVVPHATIREGLAQGVTVVCPICKEHLISADPVVHVRDAPAVLRQAIGQLQRDRQVVGIDERMKFSGLFGSKGTITGHSKSESSYRRALITNSPAVESRPIRIGDPV